MKNDWDQYCISSYGKGAKVFPKEVSKHEKLTLSKVSWIVMKYTIYTKIHTRTRCEREVGITSWEREDGQKDSEEQSKAMGRGIWW